MTGYIVRRFLSMLVTFVIVSMVIFLMGGSSGSAPADARSLARMHLRELQQRLGKPPSEKLDDATRAHLEECYARISQVMTASMQLGND